MIAVREQLLLETLTIAADTLVDDFDIVDFLHVLVERSSDICEAVDVGILFAEPKGELVVMAATSERLRVIEALQLSTGQGPSLDSYDSGEVVTAGSVDEIARRWPDFAPGVTELGYQSVHAVPLRLRRRTIGSLDFFRDACGELSAEDVRSAQTIADIATIGLLQERAIREASVARDQLQHALDARVLIEQAKGVIAHTRQVDMDTAWVLLRQRARSHQARVTDVARAVIDGLITL